MRKGQLVYLLDRDAADKCSGTMGNAEDYIEATGCGWVTGMDRCFGKVGKLNWDTTYDEPSLFVEIEFLDEALVECYWPTELIREI